MSDAQGRGCTLDAKVPFVLFGVLLVLAWVAMREGDEVLKYERGKTMGSDEERKTRC